MRRTLSTAVSVAMFAFTQPTWAQGSAPRPDTGPTGQIQAAARDAQSRCYRLIHHDTWSFRDCVASLLKAPRSDKPWRLGVAYFGWVGALNSLRVGMAGAEEAANEFLPQFRQLQKQLKIDDATLCASIEGDCIARTARMLQAEKALIADPRRPKAARPPDSEGHQH